MSTIRRQSIISSVLTYTGFALGFVNTWILARNFSPEDYGLISIFTSIANIMCAIAYLGMPSYIYKFFPYYKDNLPPRKNDMLAWVLLTALIGFAGVTILGWLCKDLVIRQFAAHSAELVKYYQWVFVFGLGMTFYTLLEMYAWQLKRSILTNYLKEIQFRAFTTLLIILFLTGILPGFDAFIRFYAFTYLLLALVLVAALIKAKEFYLVFTPSRVTRKFLSKIKSLVILTWSGSLILTVSNFFAAIVIAAVVPGGMAAVAVYNLATFIGSLLQAPQRTIVSASINPLSLAWKDKDYAKINRIYHRSSINQLIFSVGVFILAWINFTDGVRTFHFQPIYMQCRPVFFFVGLKLIVDMGTGVNAQIIATSTFWRFDFFSGLVLVTLTLPLNYFLAKEQGPVGPALADLITFTIYNAIRYIFLYRKFRMQPFTLKSLYTLLLAAAGYGVCHLWLTGIHGLIGMTLRSIVFLAIYGTGILTLKLSDDIIPVWNTIRKRLGLSR